MEKNLAMKGYIFAMALGLSFLAGWFVGHVPDYRQHRAIVVNYCDPSVVGCP